MAEVLVNPLFSSSEASQLSIQNLTRWGFDNGTGVKNLMDVLQGMRFRGDRVLQAELILSSCPCTG